MRVPSKDRRRIQNGLRQDRLIASQQTTHIEGATPRPGATYGLAQADFTPIATNGFGDAQNSYVYSMVHFNDRIYAGTLRNALPLLKLYPPQDAPVMEPWPVKTVNGVEELDLRAQIWRWDMGEKRWDNVLTSPMIPGRNGKEAPRDIGYRGMAVFQGYSDSTPALYVSTVSTVARGTAALILRSEDGEKFAPVSEPGLGNPNISTFRSLITFDGHLFAAPAGEGTNWNTTSVPIILRSPDPIAGKWELTCTPGFGDRTNTGVFELAVCNEHLYAGTFNYYDGFQLWKTPITGAAPCRWTKVIERGAYRGNLNETVMGMCAFHDALYVGTGIQNGGYDRNNRVGPAAGELLRVFPDDSWELIVGNPRQTPAGMKYPLSGMGPGFDNIFAGYIWRMTVHEGWLYVTTFDWSMFLPYAKRLSPGIKRLIRRVGIDEMIRLGAGFQLWRTQDGTTWIPVTRTGMGNPYNHGGRALVSTPHGLYLGTANPFGPEVAAKLSSGWIYVPNPNGGAEVWLGQPCRQYTDQNKLRGESEQNRVQSPQLESKEYSESSHELSNPSKLPKTASFARTNVPSRILITGVPGFIGSQVLERLLQGEERVRVLALPKALKDSSISDRVEVVNGDLRTESTLTQALEGIELVYHLAAEPMGSLVVDLMAVNVLGTKNLLRACGRAGRVRRFVFTSSTEVYGATISPNEWPYNELSPLKPRGPYHLRYFGLSKVAGESLIKRYAIKLGFETVILRPSATYGRGDTFSSALLRQTLNDFNNYPLFDGRSTQLIHVQDLADAIVCAGTHSSTANEVLNLAGLETMTYAGLANLIRRLKKVANETLYIPDRSKIWGRYLPIYDIAKAQTMIGFMPRVTIQEGLAELVAGFDNN